jgi:hypothetical protein
MEDPPAMYGPRGGGIFRDTKSREWQRGSNRGQSRAGISRSGVDRQSVSRRLELAGHLCISFSDDKPWRPVQTMTFSVGLQ